MEDSMEFRSLIKGYVTAGYPAIMIQTAEYERAIPELRSLATEVKLKFFEWNALDGITKDRGPVNEETKDPLGALLYLRKLEIPEKSMVVFKDFHFHLNGVEAIEAIRQLTDICKSSNRYLVFLSPVAEIPREVEKLIVLVEHPLPTRDEIQGMLVENLPYARDHFKKLKKEDLTDLLDSAKGLTQFEAEQAFALSYNTKDGFDKSVIHQQKKQILSKSQILEYVDVIKGDIPEVGGMNNLVTWLTRRKKATSDKAREYGLPNPKGILTAGPPGVGKSLLAKMLAVLWDRPLLRLDMGRVFAGLVGASEANMRSALRIADAMEPCILWVDEFEKGLAGISSSGSTDSGVTARVAGSFLTWMQEHKSSVFVFATANDVTKLPPELLRKGRFDELFWIDLPNEEERADIWEIHIKRIKRDPKKFDIKDLVEKSKDFTGAEIEYSLYSGMYTAFSLDQEVNDLHVMKSCLETVPIARQMSEVIQKGRDWANNRAVKATVERKDGERGRRNLS
jgi:hypothetical protein